MRSQLRTTLNMHPMHPRVTDGNKRYHVPNYLPKFGATSIGVFFPDNNPVAKVMGRKECSYGNGSQNICVIIMYITQ